MMRGVGTRQFQAPSICIHQRLPCVCTATGACLWITNLAGGISPWDTTASRMGPWRSITLLASNGAKMVRKRVPAHLCPSLARPSTAQMMMK